MSEPRSTDEATVATVSGTTAAPTAVGAGLGSDGGVMVAATTGNKHDLAAVDGDNGNGEGEGDGEGNGTVVGDVSKDGGVHNEEHDQENEQENDQGQQASEIEGKPDSDEQQVPKDGEASESFDAVSGRKSIAIHDYLCERIFWQRVAILRFVFEISC